MSLSFRFFAPFALIGKLNSPGIAKVAAASAPAAFFTPLPDADSSPGPGIVTAILALPFFLLRVTAPSSNWFEGWTSAEMLARNSGMGVKAPSAPSARSPGPAKNSSPGAAKTQLTLPRLAEHVAAADARRTSLTSPDPPGPDRPPG